MCKAPEACLEETLRERMLVDLFTLLFLTPSKQRCDYAMKFYHWFHLSPAHKSSEDAAAQALLHAKGPEDLRPAIRLLLGIFTAIALRAIYEEDRDLMRRS